MSTRNVLVDWGGQTLLNLGDLAMVMVTVRRLHRLFPEARIHVTTHRPADFLRFCPQASPIPEAAVQLLFWRRILPGMLTRAAPWLGSAEAALFRGFPVPSLKLRARRFLREPALALAGGQAIEALQNADLVVAAGGGYITDAFEGYVLRILGLLGAALHLGKPVVLLGQGLGPLQQPNLRAQAREVLSQARMITLREGLKGPAFLRELGCPDQQAQVTGDDAIELAHSPQPRDTTTARRIGFNVRLAGYAGTKAELRHAAAAVARFARERKVGIVACPVDCDPEHGDAAGVRAVVGTDTVLDPTPCPPDPAALAQRVAECRIVVTGSYHAGVFALSQGIPVVCLARSAYYEDKFAGLAAQFGPACAVVRLDQPGISRILHEQMAGQWERSTELGADAWAAAGRQLAASRAAYERLPGLVGS